MTDKSAPLTSSLDNHVPPPPDPFPTYQTPFPRRPSQFDDENPFVAFRRFADTQISNLFSNFSSFLGHNEIIGTSAQRQNQPHDLTTTVKHFEDQLTAHAADFERRLGEMVRNRHEEAEGFRKQIEQEWEEQRIFNEQRQQQVEKAWTRYCRNQDKSANPDLVGPDTELDLYPMKPTSSKQDSDPRLPESLRSHWPWLNAAAIISSGRPLVTGLGPYSDDESDYATSPLLAVLWWRSSRYSPMQLSDSAEPRLSGLLDWEAAFEDLVSETDNSNDSEKFTLPAQQDMTWGRNLLSMREIARRREGLDGFLSDFTTPGGIFPAWITALESALTEDWEVVWGSAKKNATSDELGTQHSQWQSKWQNRSSWSAGRDDDTESPISTDTTHHTYRLPTGALISKQVIRSRFTDGREEIEETTRTHDDEIAQQPSAIKKPSQTTDRGVLVEEPRSQQYSTKGEARSFGKGWFWN